MQLEPKHSEALREQIVRGRSYGEAVDAINTKFATAYTRAAALGRGKRTGLVTPARPDNPSMLVPRGPQRLRRLKPKRLKRSAEVSAAMLKCGTDEAGSPAPAAEHPEPAKLRCVGIRPRLVSLVELEADDCRYPYGGDREGEPISFCGHACFSRVQLLRARPAFSSDAGAGDRSRASGRSVRAAAE
jgi:GcrA cell cycle regulator